MLQYDNQMTNRSTQLLVCIDMQSYAINNRPLILLLIVCFIQ